MAPGLDGHSGLVTFGTVSLSRSFPVTPPGPPPVPAGTSAAGDAGYRWTRARSAVAASVLLLVVVVLTGCAGPEESGPVSARVSSWMSTAGGGAAIGSLVVDSANIDHAIATHQPASAIKTVCALLTNDAETAIGNLPTPDSRLTNDLNNAYEKAAAAGDDCYQGAEGSASLLRRSAEERKALGPLLTTALDRIDLVTGHTPSTSTTQPDGACDDPFGGCN